MIREPSTNPSSEPARVSRRLVTISEWVWRSGLVVIGALAVGWLVLYLRLVTVPAFVALLAASVLHPVVDRLRRRGWSSLLATWAAVAMAAAVVAGVGLLLVPAVLDQSEDLGDRLDGGIAEVERWLETGPLGLDDVDLRAMWAGAVDRAAGSDRLVQGITLAGEIAAGALLAIVMTFFFLKDGPVIVDRLRSFVPATRRSVVDRAAAAAWSAVGAYVRGTAVVGVVNGLVIGVGLLAIGVPLVVPLAVITALSAFFPLVGAVVAGAVAALVALFSGGVTDALLVLGLVIVVQQVEGDVLSPVVMGRALRLHPLVVLVTVTAGAIVAGILGAFLAVPLVGMAVAAAHAVRQPDGGISPDADAADG